MPAITNFHPTFDTSKVTDMSSFLKGWAASGHKNVQLQDLDMSSVVNLDHAFEGFSTPATFDFSGIVNTNTVSMVDIFNQTPVSNITVTNTSQGFVDQICESLKLRDSIDYTTKDYDGVTKVVQDFGTVRVKNADFEGSPSFTFGSSTVDKVSEGNMYYHFDVKNATLTSIPTTIMVGSYTMEVDFSNFNGGTINNLSNAFSSRTYLSKITGLNKIITPNVTIMYGTFSGSYGLTHLDFSGVEINPGVEWDGVFSGCSGLYSVKVSGCSEATINKLLVMLNAAGIGTWSLKGDELLRASIRITTDVASPRVNINGISTGGTYIDGVWYYPLTSAPITSLSSFCMPISTINSIDVSDMDTSQCTNLTTAFKGVTVDELDLSSWDVSSVTYFG